MRPYYSPLACGTKWALLSKRPMCASTFVFLLRVFLNYGLKKMEETLRKGLYLSCPVERNFPLSVSGHPVWVLAKELMNYGVAASSITAASGEWCRSPSLSSRLSTVGGKNAVKNPRVSPTSSLASKISPQLAFVPGSTVQTQGPVKAVLLNTPRKALCCPSWIYLVVFATGKPTPISSHEAKQINTSQQQLHGSPINPFPGTLTLILCLEIPASFCLCVFLQEEQGQCHPSLRTATGHPSAKIRIRPPNCLSFGSGGM